MKKSHKAVVLISILIFSLMTSACAKQYLSGTTPNTVVAASENSTIQSEGDFGAKAALQAKDLSLNQMLVYAIQDEFLAHAEYERMLATFGEQKPFQNIIKSEETHIEMLKPLFEKYKFALPVEPSKNHLIMPPSIATSLKTGVQAEIDNIAMYDLFLKQPLPEDVKNVFITLMNASKNHLDAFQKNLPKNES